MPIDIKVPSAGESITSANIARWHKADGATVRKGEVLVTFETDKVSTEFESPIDGVLHIIVPEGTEVPIGTVIASLTEAAVSDSPTPTPTPTPALALAPKPAPAVVVSAPIAAPIVTRAEVAPVESATPVNNNGRTTRKKMSMLRRKIANHLVNAQHTAAILTTFNEVDMTAVMNLRKAVQDDFTKKYQVKLGFMSFFIKAVVQALKDVPQINAMMDGTDIIENHFYDIGVAIGSEKGLIVPVIRDCDQKNFARLEQDILDYATKAREGKIALEDLQGGVFTISNGGVYGSLLSTPILNPPQSGILGMHTIQQRPVAIDGKVEIRPMMYLALSYDHRIVDGKEAVTFLIRIKECLENPTRMLLEM
jgi:2-oxoglutarate dehydrogenase E2 component (dihydrolipoamide succinyltransferase)